MDFNPKIRAVTAIAIFVAIRVYNALVISSSEPDLADKQAEQEASMSFEVDDSLSLQSR